VSDQSIQLSILIVSWNTEELLCQCIESVYEYLDPFLNFEIVVVDNASSDGTVAAVSSQFPQVNIIQNKENVGFAVAVNQAAAIASAPYLLLLNSDARFIDGSLNELLEVIGSDESIGIITGGMLTTGNRKVEPFFGFPSFIQLMKSYSIDLIHKTGKGVRGKKRKSSLTDDGHTVYEVDWASGAYLLVRRALLENAELLDGRIFMYYEDTLLCKKAWDRGFRVVCYDDLEIYHKGGASAEKISYVKSLYAYQSSRVYVEEMYGKKFVWWYERLMRLLWYSFIPILLLLGVFAFRREAGEKREIFKGLLSVPLLT
jgi:GT2 family glycosyltransferase